MSRGKEERSLTDQGFCTMLEIYTCLAPIVSVNSQTAAVDMAVSDLAELGLAAVNPTTGPHAGPVGHHVEFPPRSCPPRM